VMKHTMHDSQGLSSILSPARESILVPASVDGIACLSRHHSELTHSQIATYSADSLAPRHLVLTERQIATESIRASDLNNYISGCLSGNTTSCIASQSNCQRVNRSTVQCTVPFLRSTYKKYNICLPQSHLGQPSCSDPSDCAARRRFS